MLLFHILCWNLFDKPFPVSKTFACIRIFFIFRFGLCIRFCMRHLPSYFTEILVLLLYILYHGFWCSSFFWYSDVVARAYVIVKYYVVVVGTHSQVAFIFYVRCLYFPLFIQKFSNPHSLSRNRFDFPHMSLTSYPLCFIQLVRVCKYLVDFLCIVSWVFVLRSIGRCCLV
jgi:hypothetical protein